MTNEQIIKNLIEKNSSMIEWRMADFEETYEEAKVYVMDKSVAGDAVWKILDEKFAK